MYLSSWSETRYPRFIFVINFIGRLMSIFLILRGRCELCIRILFDLVKRDLIFSIFLYFIIYEFCCVFLKFSPKWTNQTDMTSVFFFRERTLDNIAILWESSVNLVWARPIYSKFSSEEVGFPAENICSYFKNRTIVFVAFEKFLVSLYREWHFQYVAVAPRRSRAKSSHFPRTLAFGAKAQVRKLRPKVLILPRQKMVL